MTNEELYERLVAHFDDRFASFAKQLREEWKEDLEDLELRLGRRIDGFGSALSIHERDPHAHAQAA